MDHEELKAVMTKMVEAAKANPARDPREQELSDQLVAFFENTIQGKYTAKSIANGERLLSKIYSVNLQLVSEEKLSVQKKLQNTAVSGETRVHAERYMNLLHEYAKLLLQSSKQAKHPAEDADSAETQIQNAIRIKEELAALRSLPIMRDIISDRLPI